MTRDEILALKPGPKLNRLISETFFGWMSDGKYSWINEDYKAPDVDTPYSTDISAAWQVVRKMEQLNWYLTIDPNTAEGYEQRYSVGFVYDDSTLSDEELNPLTYYQHYIACSPDEIPAAICKTALLANLEKPKKEDSDGTKN